MSKDILEALLDYIDSTIKLALDIDAGRPSGDSLLSQSNRRDELESLCSMTDEF